MATAARTDHRGETLDRVPAVRALMGLNRLYARVYHKVELLTRCPIPRDGGGAGIVACNHSAGLDPFLLQGTCPQRVITWMMAREYYEMPLVRFACERMGYIAVNRETRDATSLKAALRALAAGKLLGVFPEGRIATSRELLPFMPGVAMMASRARVPIYPAYIAGLQLNIAVGRSLLVPQTARVLYGPPLEPQRDVEALNNALQNAIEALKNQSLAYRLPRIATAHSA